MKILLACSAGMSTSLLVTNMKKVADPADVIEAHPVRTVPDIIDNWVVLLLGPQVRYLEKEYKPLCTHKGKGFGIIPLQPEGCMNGKACMELARKAAAEAGL